MKHILTIVILVTLLGCSHTPTAERLPGKYRPWSSPPKLKIEDAVTKAMAYLEHEARPVAFKDGYVLEISRGEDYWFFDFTFLPLSPDKEIWFRVYDSGDIR